MKSIAFKRRKVGGPPKDQSWCWYTIEMLQSPAFRKMTGRCRAFVEFLEIQNMHSAGHDNGRLKATYRQLAEWGIGTDWIKRTIEEAVMRGLVEIMTHGLYRGGSRNTPTEYRLTFRPMKQLSEFGSWVWNAPTDDWKRYKVQATAKINLNAPYLRSNPLPSLGSATTRRNQG